ncbi:hypothetical protein PV10_03139 [Exophiala mesophila]|uniref:Uncharacterized protein n=1 Tax=Exophiala mesophila TaxID=212818 RepID=A0A0D1ZLL2_EXOME|nr:uncharacterized protein PV10_03139 [Exophiala mesophila]KIV95487.1 hypothetical protein PV10_03139 [Exophiala mesophila]
MSSFRSLWIRWKMLRLPWRKRFLIGTDLSGNTFWEFKDALNHNRWRRIVKTSRKTHYSDVQISPQWHQWLRATRADPPSLQEQTADLERLAQMKTNARLADERWAAKAKYIEPSKPSRTPQLSDGPRPNAASSHTPVDKKSQTTTDSESSGKPSPETGSNPGQNWKPEAWVPTSSKR